MISYFLHHHVPPKNRTYILVETGRAPSHHRGHAPSLQLGSLNNGIFYMLRMPKTVCYLQLIFIEGE